MARSQECSTAVASSQIASVTLVLCDCLCACSQPHLNYNIRKGVQDAGCARVLHLPAAQRLMSRKATQTGSLVATAVGVQYSQNAEMW